MKTVSRAALGLALALGAVAPLAVSPAIAKEKKAKPAPQKVWQLSKEFRAAYGWLSENAEGIAIDPQAAALLRVQPGDRLTYVPRW